MSGFDPRALFEVILPALFEERREAFRPLSGRVEITLLGREESRWFIDLDPDPPTISESTVGRASLSIEIDRGQVERLLRGELDLEAAKVDGTVFVAGDLGLLSRLSRALTATRMIDLRKGAGGRT